MFALETINNTLTAIGGWEVKQKKLQTKQKLKCCVSMIYNKKNASFRLSVIFLREGYYRKNYHFILKLPRHILLGFIFIHCRATKKKDIANDP